eukprot:scaffold650688_cov32-Prasinocladus_malaysianus.AAC.1
MPINTMLCINKDSHAPTRLTRHAMVFSGLCRSIMEELVKDANFEQQSVCRQYLKEIEPNVRYCEYQME